jgi:hypothetical protein
MHCPICRSPLRTNDAKPFCSRECRLADLERWLDGSYRIPADEDAGASSSLPAGAHATEEPS